MIPGPVFSAILLQVRNVYADLLHVHAPSKKIFFKGQSLMNVPPFNLFLKSAHNAHQQYMYRDFR